MICGQMGRNYSFFDTVHEKCIGCAGNHEPYSCLQPYWCSPNFLQKHIITPLTLQLKQKYTFFEDHCNTDLYSILNLDYKQHGRTKVNIKALVQFRSVLNDSTSPMYQHTNLIIKILWIWIAKWNCLRDCLYHIYSSFLTEQIHKFMISSWVVSLVFDWTC